MSLSRRGLLAAAAAAPLVSSEFAQAQEAATAKIEVVETEHIWVAMADGVRLSARLFLPKGPDRVPAVLEYIPYRKRDAYRSHDTAWGHELAGRGIAYVRVDVRGSGDSEGVLTDEYDHPELNDGVAVIAWIAAQPWCSGAVGMRGLSWGGINTLQIAAMRPPALKAILAMGATDTRYGNDAHYVGGALGHTNLQWAVGFKTVMAGPPDPDIVGPGWEAMWRQRLAATPDIMTTWLTHQTDDAYWRRGSVDQDWSAIAVPTYVVSGWQDSYSNPVGRILERLKVPKKGLIGPWGHTYPWTAEPMSLDWAYEEARWWNHWLKGEANGVMDEPMLRAFMPYATWSESRPVEIPGRWIAESVWPSPKITPQILHFTTEGLSNSAGPASTRSYRGDRLVGLTKPEWIDRPPIEQSLDDAKCLVFDGLPLADDLEILGYPLLRVRVGADRPVAKIAVRITELTVDGRSWLVTYGLKNLTHRASDTAPSPLMPGQFYDVEFPLNMVGHRFRRGSRIRVAISENLWPLAWPSPEIVTLEIALDQTSLTLPVRSVETSPAAFSIPIRHAPPPVDPLPPPEVTTQPVGPGHYRIELDSPPVPATRPDTGVTTSRGRWETSEAIEEKPNAGLWRQQAVSTWSRGDWDCTVTATLELKSTPIDFQLAEGLVAKSAGKVIYEHHSTSSVRRNLV